MCLLLNCNKNLHQTGPYKIGHPCSRGILMKGKIMSLGCMVTCFGSYINRQNVPYGTEIQETQC